MKRPLLALFPAILLLLHPELRTAVADLVIHDPPVGPTTAVDNGVPVACDPALTIRLSDWVMPDGQVSFSVYGQIGTNGHGPVWVAGIIDGGQWCAWTGCTVGRLGWHNVGGPLGDPSFGSLSLGDRVGNRVTVDRGPSGTTLTIIDPPSIFAILDAYFAGRLTLGQFFNELTAYFGG